MEPLTEQWRSGGVGGLRLKPGWGRPLSLVLLAGVAAGLGWDFFHHLAWIESWIRSHGWVGGVVFVAAAAALMSVFVPETAIAVVAGVMFGIVGGTALMVSAAFCAAALDFALARWLLRRPLNRALESRPRLAAIQRAVEGEGLRLQLLLRLSPTNPVLLHYVLGAGPTDFRTYMTACAGLIPTVAVEVYFGHATGHVADALRNAGSHSPGHTLCLLAGVGIGVGVLMYIARVTRRALAGYEPS